MTAPSRKKVRRAATRAPQLAGASRAAGAEPGHDLEFNFLASACIAIRTGPTLRRRWSSAAVGAPPKCCGVTSRPVPRGLCSTGARPQRAPTLSPRLQCLVSSRAPGRWRLIGFGAGGRFSFAGSCDCRALPNLVACSHEPGSQAARESADVLPVVGVVFHADQHGGRFVPNPRNLFTFEGKDDERRC